MLLKVEALIMNPKERQIEVMAKKEQKPMIFD
jgi:hypothetical protein